MTTSNEIWSEWIEHPGGFIPIGDDVDFEYKLNSGSVLSAGAKASEYKHEFLSMHEWPRIIAYRYKLEYEAMPEDLEWLAKHVTLWDENSGNAKIVFRGKEFSVDNATKRCGFSKAQWLDARQKLGLDSPDSDETHNNPTTEEDDAFRHVEQMCGSDKPTAADILRAGMGHMEDRARTYDNPEGERSMAATVAAFEEVTGIDMTEEQGWLFMVLLKAVRSQQGNFKLDNYEDLAAYAGLCGEAAAIERS